LPRGPRDLNLPDSIRHSSPTGPTGPGKRPSFALRGGIARKAGIAVALLITVAGAGVLWIRSAARQQVEHASASKVITIEQGAGTNTIVDRLTEAGIVRHSALVKLYLRFTGDWSGLKAGDYTFQSPISAVEALEKIRRGEVALDRVTIPEGFNRFDIAQALASRTGKATAEQYLKLTEDQSLIRRLAPSNKDLEGYLFPDTYNYSPKTTPEELIQAMVSRFEDVFAPQWAARASELGLTVNQVVTLASIVEKEAREDDERPIIASVFHNRLKRRMPLASDPTFIFAAILAGDYDGNPNQPRHRSRISAYNTYQVSGLPPAPIASPGRASLEATLYPAKTDYLYFVAIGNTGRHRFSRTAAEHELAVADYRRYQQESRARGLR
jgi:UPF0755 protein